LSTARDRQSSPVAETAGEISAVLGAAYESFLRTRIARRCGRRGKVHRRALLIAVDMVVEMITEVGGRDPEALWRAVIAELDRERADIQADVLEHHGHIVVEHEWAAFLAWICERALANSWHACE